MWPAAHSSGSRTSTTVAPFETCSRTTAGSISSILVLIWRRTSAPDGIVETPQRQYGFNTSQSIAPGHGAEAPRGVPVRRGSRADNAAAIEQLWSAEPLGQGARKPGRYQARTPSCAAADGPMLAPG